MANVLYPKGKEKFMSGSLNMASDDIKAVLIDIADYTYNVSHEFLSSIAAAARVATSGNLSGKSITNGIFDADDITLSSVNGDSIEAVVIYKDTGDAATSPLIVYIDSGTGLPITPNNNAIVVQWDNGDDKIFSL